MSSLDQRSDLDSHVRTVTIRYREDRGRKKKRTKNASLRANDLLKRIPNIRLLFIDWEYRKSTFLPDYLSHTNHPHLREITSLGWKTSLGEICDSMGTTSLSWSRMSSDCLERSPTGRDSPKLSLMNLGRTHLPHPQLHKLLELAPSVATLQCATPGL